MVAVNSTMLPLGTKAPAFSLPDTDGKRVSLDDYKDAKAFLVIFMCNHCPYVVHVADHLAKLAAEYQKKGVAVVGINANDVQKHPTDGPAAMKEEKAKRGYTFPYLFDETQETAKAYRAACTPDFYVFDAQKRLVYRGQLDDSRPKTAAPLPVTGKDLRAALDAALADQGGRGITTNQKPSMGCNIKWKPGNAPEYFPA